MRMMQELTSKSISHSGNSLYNVDIFFYKESALKKTTVALNCCKIIFKE